MNSTTLVATPSLTDRFAPATELAGRALMAAIFVLSGYGKLSQYAGTQAYMQAAGVPGSLLPAVIAVELLGGLAIIAGLWTRPVATLLAGFSIVTAFLFHGGSDQVSQIMFLKNLAMAGGFLVLLARGAGDWSLDSLLNRAHVR